MYDVLIIGAGLFGSVFARLATDAGKRCLVIDKRSHIAGNCYTNDIDGMQVHQYGPHIFHCSDIKIWNFINRFADFNNFRNSPIAINNGKIYSLPFNMYTFNQLWGVTTPKEAMEKIESQKLRLSYDPTNLEEQALSLVGNDIYNILIKDYTRKQWQKDPKELPAHIIKRLPIRFAWDNNYFNDKYQGIPIGGYTVLFERMLKGIEVKIGIDYFKEKAFWNSKAKTIVFSGKIDEFYDFQFGELEYRSLKFETEIHEMQNYQGNAVVNYTAIDTPWTRIIEHKYFDIHNNANMRRTIITREIPSCWNRNMISYYPINDDNNMYILGKYTMKANTEKNVIFGGRLAEYKYYDMHQVIESAFEKFSNYMIQEAI